MSALPALDELARYDQWVCWRLLPPLEPGKKPRKVPIDAATGHAASTTDSATWGAFEAAMERCERHADIAGVGFVFSEDDPFAGVDLDGCRDSETGAIAAWAQAIVGQLDSYTEVSPSGTGLHLFVRAAVPLGGNRSGAIELYDHARYFTVTGNHLPGTPDAIVPRHRPLRRLHEELFGEAEAAMPPLPQLARRPVEPDDAALLRRMFDAQNGIAIRRLWDGDTARHGEDDSRADLALVSHLLYWTGGDRGRADRLFRESGLYRPKWDEQRGAVTYGERTLGRVAAR